MGRIDSFEDLDCWQVARHLVKLVFECCERGKMQQQFELKNQLKKAALSSVNNIAEGFSRFHTKDSIRFYDISQSSLAEVKSMLFTIEDLDLLTASEIEELKAKTEEARNLTLGLIRYLNKTKTAKT